MIINTSVCSFFLFSALFLVANWITMSSWVTIDSAQKEREGGGATRMKRGVTLADKGEGTCRRSLPVMSHITHTFALWLCYRDTAALNQMTFLEESCDRLWACVYPLQSVWSEMRHLLRELIFAYNTLYLFISTFFVSLVQSAHRAGVQDAGYADG